MATVLPTGEPLVGRHVRLDLLTEEDLPALAPLLLAPEVYGSGYVMHRRPADEQDAGRLARERFLTGPRTPYAVRLAADSALGERGALVGTSALLDADVANQRIHLGSTLYGPRWWGSVVNPEAKLLLLGHCFDTCGYGRVKIQTDLLNTRSQAAITRLGAVREGVLRRHMRREDGTFRDTVVFSVLREEWPQVQQGLQDRLARA